MISKELLSVVLDLKEPIVRIAISEVKPSYINYALTSTARIFQINSHELAHKCKEWVKGRYSISSYPTYFGYGATLTDFMGNSPKNLIITKNTEPEAIFKACEWILKNKQGG